MSNHRFGRALLACALTSTLAAQESGGQFRFVPEDSVLVMKLAGPAAWGEAFADTSLRDLLDGATLGPMLRAADDRLTALLEASDELPFDPVELRATVEGNTGDLLLAVMMDVGSLPDAIENDEAPGLAVGVILSDDGHTDLQTLVDLVTEKVEEENRDGLTDLAIGAHRLRVQVSNDPQASLPQLIDGDVVMLIGSDLEQQAGWFLEAEDHFEPDEMLLQSQLALHLDFSGIIPGFVEAIAELSSGDERQIELLEILGLMSLESLDLTLTADESYLASTIQIRCNDRPRGLLDLYGRGDEEGPQLLEYLPTNTPSFSATPFRIDAVYDVLTEAWDMFDDVAPMSRAEAEEMVTEMLKVRLKADLIDHLGAQKMTLQEEIPDPSELYDDDIDGLSDILGDTCIALSLRDGRAFGESLETALRSRGLHVARKSEEYQGERINRLNLLGLTEIEYVVTDDVLALAIGGGEGGKRGLRGLLDERAARRSGEPAGELPKAIRERLSRMPADWNGLTVTSVTEQLQSFWTILEPVSDFGVPGLPDADMVQQFIESLEADLRQLGLDRVVMTMTITPDGIDQRLRW